jgi:hypothetical protein
LTRFLASLLYGVQPTDVATYVQVGLGLGLAAAVSVLVPALRAIRIDPKLALGSE